MLRNVAVQSESLKKPNLVQLESPGNLDLSLLLGEIEKNPLTTRGTSGDPRLVIAATPLGVTLELVRGWAQDQGSGQLAGDPRLAYDIIEKKVSARIFSRIINPLKHY
jgi:hypothetical protein